MDLRLLGLALAGALTGGSGGGADAPPPAVKILSATVTAGTGRQHPGGSPSNPQELVVVLKLHGIVAARADARVTLSAPPSEGRTPILKRLLVGTWTPLDSGDPSIIRLTARWPNDAPYDGCTALLEIRKAGKNHMASRPVLRVLRPAGRHRGAPDSNP
jgi:hypothetical protein